MFWSSYAEIVPKPHIKASHKRDLEKTTQRLFDLQGCYYSVKLGTWASTTIKIMVDPFSMIKILR